MTIPTPEAVREALAGHNRRELPALPGRTNHLRAGIAVPLVWESDDVIALSTLRPEHLGNHGGEVCWPGGNPEPCDRDIEATALRELREELGVRSVEVLGRLSSIPLYTSDYRLEPIVVTVERAEVAPAPDEVAAVIPLSLRALLQATSQPAIPSEYQGRTMMAPIFDADGIWMFGGTAIVFRELLEVIAPLVGREAPELVDSGVRWTDVL